MSQASKLVTALALAVPFLVPVSPAQAGPSVLCGGRVATIVGTDGWDVLRGTDGPDVIAGLRGSDKIRGFGGADVICGGPGSDDLEGGRGNDRLYGGADRVYEGFSPGGATYLIGVGDLLSGGPGDDHLDAGNDTRPSFWDPRTDGLVFHSRHGVELRLSALGSKGSAVGEGRDVVVGQPNLSVKGSPGPDVIWGSPYDDLIDGAAGDDIIRGRGGDDVITDGGRAVAPDRDVLLGGSGIDHVTARFGGDVINGGPDVDWLRSSSIQLVALRGGSGNDQMTYGAAGRGCPMVDGGRGRDRFGPRAGREISAFTLRVVLDGPMNGCGVVRSTEVLWLGPGYNERWEVVGTDRPETVRAIRNVRLIAYLRGGNDVAEGANRDDLLIGGPGHDEVDGMLGTDTCRGFEEVVNCERD